VKADISQLNLLHRAKSQKSGKKEIKNKNRYAQKCRYKQSEESGESVPKNKKKKRATVGRICKKKDFKPRVKE